MLREVFVNRGAKLYNQLPVNMKSESNIGKFKTMAKEWTKKMIPLKP